jgi:hypothetical protein
VNAVSKSGTNSFHGATFEFFRDNALDARSPFDPSEIPPFRMNQFGANLGGPLAQNRTFFFVNYEGIRQTLTQTTIGFVPNASFRARVLATSPALKPIVDACFGHITNILNTGAVGTGTPRRMQLMARVEF